MVDEKVRSPVSRRRRALSDDARADEIRGAFGVIREHERTTRRTWRQRLLALAAIMGPGLIVMVGDNDAGGVSTYAQAGQNFGTSLLWTMVLLIPVLIVNQEMVVRLGAVTGVGHARLIFERFGRRWGTYSVSGLFILNFLTIATEFVGIALGAAYFGVNAHIAVPIAAALLVAITVTGRFERWERLMFVFVVANLLVIPLAVLSHPGMGTVFHDLVVPGLRGGFSSNAALLIVAIVGTTVTPWQIFFQQSNIVDKRITPRWIAYERTDTVIGALVVVVGAAAIMIAAAFAFNGTSGAGHFVDARGVAHGMRDHVGPALGAIFAIILIDASIIGASAVTLATSYAFGDVFGIRNSLHRSWRDAKPFYALFTGLVVVAAGIVLIPGAPLGLFTTAVQALAGLLLPGATLFLLLLCNDAALLGPWVNRSWFNALAGVIMGLLLMLSLILVVTTIFPAVDAGVMVAVLAALLAPGLIAVAALSLRRAPAPVDAEDRESWRMPPIALLSPPARSRVRQLALTALSAYIVVAILLLLVKAVQLATHGG